MTHKAVVTVEVESENLSECNISVEMFPPVSKDQDNAAAGVAMKMILMLQGDAD